MIGRRHPSPIALASWFDGESDGDLAPHLAVCERCMHRVEELGRIRSALRTPTSGSAVGSGALASASASAGTSGLTRGDRPRRLPRLVAPVAVAAAVALIAVLGGELSSSPRVLNGRDAAIGSGVATAGRPAPAGRTSSAPAQSSSQSDGAPAPDSSADGAGSARTGTPAAPAAAASGSSAPSVSPPRPNAPADQTSGLQLAVIVPVSGPLSGEGAAAADAVRHAVDTANRAGGVNGRPVELRVVAAEDRNGIAHLRGWAQAVVGGFGAEPPAGVPWVLPADPAAVHDGAVPGEASPSDAGSLLAAQLFSEQATGQVGVVVGDGPEAALGDAFRAKPSTAVARLARGSTCDSEVAALRRTHATALVLALDPQDAVRCGDAAARLGWDPDGGVVVAPSVPYALTSGVPPSLLHARTALGLPWPGSAAPGAAHFRSDVPGSFSYRALVSFAATELVIAVARAQQPVTVTVLDTGTWSTQLLVLDHGHNRGIKVVRATSGGWEAA